MRELIHTCVLLLRFRISYRSSTLSPLSLTEPTARSIYTSKQVEEEEVENIATLDGLIKEYHGNKARYSRVHGVKELSHYLRVNSEITLCQSELTTLLRYIHSIIPYLVVH